MFLFDYAANCQYSRQMKTLTGILSILTSESLVEAQQVLDTNHCKHRRILEM